MAAGQTAQPVNDWQTVNEPGDWQTVGGNSAPNASSASLFGANGQPSLFDRAKTNFNANTQGAAPGDGMVKGALKNFGAGGGDVIRSAGHVVMHPIDAMEGLAKSVTPDASLEGLGEAALGPFGKPLVDTTKNLIRQPARTLGQMGTGAILGEGVGSGLDMAAKGLRGAGAPMERAGLGAVNNALGARGPKMFQYGQNAARGAIDEGVVPAMSKHSASMRLDPAMDRVGGQIANTVQSSPNRILLDKIAPSVETPLNESRAVMEGPGGGPGRSSAPLDELQSHMTHQAPEASQPIYREPPPSLSAPHDPTAPIHNQPALHGTSDASASDLWNTIRNLDKNTRFNPQPEIEGMNDVRRDIRGGLSGNLKEAVPEVSPHMQSYSDLSTARDALDRTMHSGTPLKRLLDAASFPAETAGGTALVKGGRMLQSINPPFLRNLAPIGAVAGGQESR